MVNFAASEGVQVRQKSAEDGDWSRAPEKDSLALAIWQDPAAALLQQSFRTQLQLHERPAGFQVVAMLIQLSLSQALASRRLLGGPGCTAGAASGGDQKIRGLPPLPPASSISPKCLSPALSARAEQPAAPQPLRKHHKHSQSTSSLPHTSFSQLPLSFEDAAAHCCPPSRGESMLSLEADQQLAGALGALDLEPYVLECIRMGVSTNKGQRLSMEDFAFAMPLSRPEMPGIWFKQGACFGVFDGHGGSEVAQSLAEHLPDRIQDSVHHIASSGPGRMGEILLGHERRLREHPGIWSPSTSRLPTQLPHRVPSIHAAAAAATAHSRSLAGASADPAGGMPRRLHSSVASLQALDNTSTLSRDNTSTLSRNNTSTLSRHTSVPRGASPLPLPSLATDCDTTCEEEAAAEEELLINVMSMASAPMEIPSPVSSPVHREPLMGCGSAPQPLEVLSPGGPGFPDAEPQVGSPTKHGGAATCQHPGILPPGGAQAFEQHRVPPGVSALQQGVVEGVAPHVRSQSDVQGLAGQAVCAPVEQHAVRPPLPPARAKAAPSGGLATGNGGLATGNGAAAHPVAAAAGVAAAGVAADGAGVCPGWSQTNWQQAMEGRDPGSTALVATVIDSRMFVANVGDCRLILAVRQAETGHVVPMVVTTDHVPHAHAGERARLEALQVPVSPDGYVGPDGGVLQVSRSIGDFHTKANLGEQVILSEPELHTVELGPQHFFAVAASDGITCAMQDDTIVNQVCRYLNEPGPSGEFNDPEHAAEQLVQYAINSANSADNASAIVTCFKLEKPPLPPGPPRRWGSGARPAPLRRESAPIITEA